jgi:hypothetical protein
VQIIQVLRTTELRAENYFARKVAKTWNTRDTTIIRQYMYLHKS